MVILKRKTNIILTIIALLLTSVPVALLSNHNFTSVNATDCNAKDEECQKAKEKEEQANYQAIKAASSANAYQNKVNELALEITAKENEIAETTAKVEDLKQQIVKTEAELTEEQDALVELLVDMHFESDAEPIKVLAGSTSISDLAEKTAREEVVKEQISATATAIRESKAALEAQKQEVEDLLAEQQSARESLAAQKLEQQEFVKKYENDADAYEAVAAEARKEKIAAMKKYQEEHAEEYGGNVFAGAYNSYPWQDECPDKQDFYISYWNGLKIGGYVCECVSYAGWKAYETFGVAAAWGNAYDWGWRAENAGYRVDHEPAPNTIGQSGGAPYGHVFWVEDVNSDGSINVTEYNNAYATYLYSGSSHYGDFGARVIPASEVGNYNYIHFE